MQKPPSNLDQYEAKAFSQFGEDGISKYIFDKIKNDNYYFVEIGTQDGSECNTRYLRENLNWQGIQFDAKYENSLINLKNLNIFCLKEINLSILHRCFLP